MFRAKIFAGGILSVLLAAGLTRVTYSMIQGAPINVLDKGADKTGVADSTAAFNAALTALPAQGGTLFIPPGNYKINTQLAVTKARTHILGYGAKITQTGVYQRGFSVTAAGVVIEGVYLYNANGATEWVPGAGSSNNARGIFFDTGSDDAKAINCKVENFAWAGITVYQSSRVEVRGNDIIGIGAAAGLVTGSNNNLGIEWYLTGLGYNGARIIGNSLRDLAQGIFMGDQWEDVVISNNHIHNIIGQHGMYLGGLRNASITGNTISVTGQQGIKLQIAATTPAPPAGDSINIAVSGNSINGTLGVGIAFLAGSAGLSPYFYNVQVTGNTIMNTGDAGIVMDHADNYLISGNTLQTIGLLGIRVRSEAHSGRIVGNILSGVQQSAIYVQAVSTSYVTTIENNTIDTPCLSAAGAADLRSVIYLSTGAWIVRTNHILSIGSCTSNVNSHASALVTLGRNIIPSTLNNTIAGTIVNESLIIATPGNGVTVVPDIQATTHLWVTVGFATWTAGVPKNVDSQNFLAITVSNTSGGAITTTWGGGGIYKMAAWVEPANTFQKTITFRRNGVNWYEVSRTADVPN